MNGLALEYNCYQHEADTRILFYAFVRQGKENDIPVDVDAEGRNVVSIAIHFPQPSSRGLYLF